MGERYIISGVQLGMLSSEELTAKQKSKIISRIIETQFVGNSRKPIKVDIRDARKKLN